MVDLTLISGFFNLFIGFDWKWNFGASQSGDSVTSIPAVFVFFVFNVTLMKKYVFVMEVQ